MLTSLLDRVGIVRPAGRERLVAGLCERLGPAVPAARQQPQPVDEHHWRTPGRVGPRHLLLGRLGHGTTLWDPNRTVPMGPSTRPSDRDLRSSGGAAGTRSGRRQFSDGVADRGDHDERLVEAADLQNAPDYRLW